MSRKEKVKSLIQQLADELYEFVKEKEPLFKDGWVPAATIKDELELNFVCVPKANKQYGSKGWVFAALARILEDQGRIEYKKTGNRSFCKTK